jgi:glucuronate isomerase
MKPFMGENFLLENDSAVKLYHEYAKGMPIIDYHCHLDAKDIFENKRFKNITEVWLYGDHYKWRAMRSDGTDEESITGSATDYEKFLAWAKTLEKCIGNPLYHWTHLELQRYFGIYEPLAAKTADDIWRKANALLALDEYSAQGMIEKSNVKCVCTTDDPGDSLEYHQKIREDASIKVKVFPTFRPDKGMELNASGFTQWIERVGLAAGITITNYNEFLQALAKRIEFFHEMGCRAADHALEKVPYLESSQEVLEAIFADALQGKVIVDADLERYKTAVLQFCGRKYANLGWAMQLHIGALRNNNTKMFKKMGPDTGFDSIHDHQVAFCLSRLLDSLEIEGCLPRVILYTLNPKDNGVLGTMLGNFQAGGIPGKMQFGTAWWFIDNKTGMSEQMISLSNLGLLSRFVGMVTDSRSFLSYTRHEYFRRILCNLLGTWIENGEVAADFDMVGEIVKDISFNNAKTYFGFPLE